MLKPLMASFLAHKIVSASFKFLDDIFPGKSRETKHIKPLLDAHSLEYREMLLFRLHSQDKALLLLVH